MKALVRVPPTVTAGEVFDVKVLIRHKMETGHRRDRRGEEIPRDIIHSFRAEFNGRAVFSVDLFPGIAANPFIEFRLRVSTGGPLTLRWADDSGAVHEQHVAITVA